MSLDGGVLVGAAACDAQKDVRKTTISTELFRMVGRMWPEFAFTNILTLDFEDHLNEKLDKG